MYTAIGPVLRMHLLFNKIRRNYEHVNELFNKMLIVFNVSRV